MKQKRCAFTLESKVFKVLKNTFSKKFDTSGMYVVLNILKDHIEVLFSISNSSTLNSSSNYSETRLKLKSTTIQNDFEGDVNVLFDINEFQTSIKSVKLGKKSMIELSAEHPDKTFRIDSYTIENSVIIKDLNKEYKPFTISNKRNVRTNDLLSSLKQATVCSKESMDYTSRYRWLVYMLQGSEGNKISVSGSSGKSITNSFIDIIEGNEGILPDDNVYVLNVDICLLLLRVFRGYKETKQMAEADKTSFLEYTADDDNYCMKLESPLLPNGDADLSIELGRFLRSSTISIPPNYRSYVEMDEEKIVTHVEHEVLLDDLKELYKTLKAVKGVHTMKIMDKNNLLHYEIYSDPIQRGKIPTVNGSTMNDKTYILIYLNSFLNVINAILEGNSSTTNGTVTVSVLEVTQEIEGNSRVAYVLRIQEGGRFAYGMLSNMIVGDK